MPRKPRPISDGDKFGRLTVVRQVGYNSYGCRMFECRCDCGNTVEMRATHLYEDRRYCTRSCPLLSDQRVPELTGRVFGRWTVKSRAGQIKNDATWNCVCECGTTRIVRGFNLVDGSSKSCGCTLDDRVIYKTQEAKIEAKRRMSRVSARKNPARMKANKIKYENKRSQATPKWLTDEHWAAMNAMYAEARRLTQETGVRHEVDHIHPINGKTLSGLHVPWNLQILTQAQNVAKSNRYAEHSGD